jgi:hypothetical protein
MHQLFDGIVITHPAPKPDAFVLELLIRPLPAKGVTATDASPAGLSGLQEAVFSKLIIAAVGAFGGSFGITLLK